MHETKNPWEGIEPSLLLRCYTSDPQIPKSAWCIFDFIVSISIYIYIYIYSTHAITYIMINHRISYIIVKTGCGRGIPLCAKA